MEIRFVNEAREEGLREHWSAVMYRFSISNESTHANGDVVLTQAGVNIIEQHGKDPQTAARVALERLLMSGRNPFETQILLKIPFGHAEYFSRHGNYEALPTLTE
jgi:hypothetical protein